MVELGLAPMIFLTKSLVIFPSHCSEIILKQYRPEYSNIIYIVDVL